MSGPLISMLPPLLPEQKIGNGEYRHLTSPRTPFLPLLRQCGTRGGLARDVRIR